MEIGYLTSRRNESGKKRENPSSVGFTSVICQLNSIAIGIFPYGRFFPDFFFDIMFKCMKSEKTIFS